jgi:hypothetical protein
MARICNPCALIRKSLQSRKGILTFILFCACQRGLLLSADKRSKNSWRQIARRPASFRRLNCKNSLRSDSLQFLTPASNGRCPPAQSTARLSGVVFYFLLAGAAQKWLTEGIWVCDCFCLPNYSVISTQEESLLGTTVHHAEIADL